MFRLRFLFLTVFAIAIGLGCSGGDKGSDNNNDDKQKELQQIENILVVQDSLGNLIDDMFATLDTATVKDSLVRLFEADTTNVLTVTSSSQGVSVAYKNGMRGGVLLNPLDLGGMPPIGPTTPKAATTPAQTSFENHRPVSKKTIFLNPSYWERQAYANPLMAQANAGFVKTGYNNFEVYLNDQCTIERFAALSGYGVVHIYSHGWAWPSEADINEVYLMTGEIATAATTAKYFADVKAGKIPIVQYGHDNRYFISPSFVANKNSFHDDTTFVYLGFCYSWLGNWQDSLIEVAGAGACVGFDWSVYTSWNAMWAQHLYHDLCDTSRTEPMTLGYWRDTAPAISNTYWDPTNLRWVSIWRQGHSDLTMWSALRVLSIDPPTGQIGTPVKIRGVGFGNLMGTSTVKFNGVAAAPISWSDSLINTVVPEGATNGGVIVKVGDTESNAFPFALSDVSISLDADSVYVVPGDTVYFRAGITGTTDSSVIWRQDPRPQGNLGIVDSQAPNQCRFRIYSNQPGVCRLIAIAHADTTKRDTVIVASSILTALQQTKFFWTWSDAKTQYSILCGNPDQYSLPNHFSMLNSANYTHPLIRWEGSKFSINSAVSVGGSPWWYRDSLVFIGEVNPLGDTLRTLKILHKVSGSDPTYRAWYTWIEARDIPASSIYVQGNSRNVTYRVDQAAMANSVQKFEDYYFESNTDGSCRYERRAVTVDWAAPGFISRLSITLDINSMGKLSDPDENEGSITRSR